MTLDLDELESNARAEDDQRWLFSQFQAACETLRERSSYRRGPFLVDESDLPIASSAHKATMLALIAHIRQLEADNKDFLEQIAVQTESVLFKELQEIMTANNALQAENERQRARETQLVEALVSIEEYWNRSPTDGAMLDALDVMTRRARAAIEEVNRE
jgi:hypothetical protein